MKKINLKVRAVIFDMDGVITNTMPDHFRAWKNTLGHYGVHVNHLDIYCREGQPGTNSVQEIFSEKHKPYTPKLVQEILRKKEELFKKIAKRRFIPGARSFIRYLHQSHFQLALVTGTSRSEVHRILPGYLYRLFDGIITGNDVKKGKPDPEPYLLALKRLKIRPQEAVVIENAPFGIRSAKAAGLKCLAVATSLPKEHLNGADHIFPDLKIFRRKCKFIVSGHHKR